MMFAKHNFLENGKIVSINISNKKGIAKYAIANCIVDNNGIVKDSHAGNWHRQISILPIEVIDKFASMKKTTIRPGEFAENITISGINCKNIFLFDKFIIGSVVLEVTQIGKECHGDTCEIFRRLGKCIMPYKGIFCKVLKGGYIEVKNHIECLHRYLNIAVVTISDSIFKRKQVDYSGPKIIDLISNYLKNQKFQFKIHTKLLSDNLDQLEKELLILCNNKDFDIIITTGGTGISNRDNTPEAVRPLINKFIPGLMEFARINYAKNNLKTLLSRSIAGISNNNALIYTLPGSINAVKEYCEIILPTIKHSLFLLNNITQHNNS